MNIDINTQKTSGVSSVYYKIFWLISIVLSLIVRLHGLTGSSYEWRPHQTGLTAFWFEKEGIDILHYQTPLYGPPWQIPFEFPLFQAVAAVLSKAGLGDIVFTSRLTALLCFYLVALILYVLCKKVFNNRLTEFIIISFFLWLPYNIFYSTEPLIDYLALALSLAYLYFILMWSNNKKPVVYILLAIASGSLAILVKPTTTSIAIVTIITFVIKDILSLYRDIAIRKFNFRAVFNKTVTNLDYWIPLFAIAIIPILLGSIWTHHSDNIKNISIFTQWLTSDSLKSWNFGTWEMRANQLIWIEHAQVGLRWLLPYGLQMFSILGLFVAMRIVNNAEFHVADDTILFVLSIGLGISVTFSIFLNLYLHEYYFIAWSASLSILAGYGFSYFWSIRSKLSSIVKFAFAIWLLVFIAGNVKDFLMFDNRIEWNTQQWKIKTAWAHEVQRYIPEDEWVVVVDYDWSPTYPYLLERKAMVFSPKDEGKPICKMVKNEKFTLVVLADPRYQDNLERVLKCFKSHTEVMPGVFQVRHKK